MKSNKTFTNIDSLLTKSKNLDTPFFAIDSNKIQVNLDILQHVLKTSGCKILLAQKAFSCYDFYSLISSVLSGTTASGLYEAKLANEYFNNSSGAKKENHVFAPAFKDKDIVEIVKICDYIVFNSGAQLKKHFDICTKNKVSVSLRVNPEHSTQSSGDNANHSLYDPCAPLSRFGVKQSDDIFNDKDLYKKLDGLHFHTLCQQGFEDLESTFLEFENKFGEFFKKLCDYKNLFGDKKPYLNMGGGHHITKADYNVEALIAFIKKIKQKYNCDVYLEPGEAVVLNAGYLVSRVLDIINISKPLEFVTNYKSQIANIAILDTSAACHNPDILETQHDYMPPIYNASKDKANYQLAGNSCLTGDIIGNYNFEKLLKVGDKIVFGDTALYTIVKTNTFNGLPLPDIYAIDKNNNLQLIRKADYNDFKSRLGR